MEEDSLPKPAGVIANEEYYSIYFIGLVAALFPAEQGSEQVRSYVKHFTM